MITSPELETGIGDIEGEIRADVRSVAASRALADEWERLRAEGMGGVYLVVRDLPCPFTGTKHLAFEGTYQLLLNLERALEKSGLSDAVIFTFTARIPPPRPATGWELVKISSEKATCEAVAAGIERELQMSSRTFPELWPQNEPLDGLRSTGHTTLLLHSRVRFGLERWFRSREITVEFCARMLTRDEVLARGLDPGIHHPLHQDDG